MKGIILAGGKGTRLYPLTRKTNKHMLPVGREPMLFNPVRQLLSAGINDILIVSSSEYIDEMRAAVSCSGFEAKFSFKAQQEAGGIAHALLLAEDFVGNDKSVVILGDNIATHSIKPYVESFKTQSVGAKILISRVEDPDRFGVAVFCGEKLERIAEKPRGYMGSFVVTGIYFYDGRVFDIIRTIAPSCKGELEITPVNNIYLSRGELSYDIIRGTWIDAGTLEAYKRAGALLSAVGNEIITDK